MTATGVNHPDEAISLVNRLEAKIQRDDLTQRERRLLDLAERFVDLDGDYTEDEPGLFTQACAASSAIAVYMPNNYINLCWSDLIEAVRERNRCMDDLDAYADWLDFHGQTRTASAEDHVMNRLKEATDAMLRPQVKR